jgi:endo-1,4-beta-xylanase
MLTNLLALNEDGTNRNNVFLRVIGEQYMPIAFRMAAAADPTAKLYYNDYNLEYGEAKHQGALRIVKLIQSWGVKIDGVGLQGHLVSESTGTQSTATPSVAVLTKTLQDYADLNVDVAYTELDIRSNTPSNSNKLTAAAAAWGRVAQSCINVSRCVGMTIWVSFFACYLPVSRTDTAGCQELSVVRVLLFCGTIVSRRSLRTLLSLTS